MQDIILLEENLINQIAAGEVIERPASVIKELVENSIDANADEISIVIKNGGKNYISVTDNGKGIKNEDLAFSIKRFATSKLKSNNLFGINSFGFRGEALAAIASVSSVEIKTKHEKESCGFLLKNEQNGNYEIIPTKYLGGTRVTVKNLFCNIPARLKFLKSDNIESLYAFEIIKTIALAHPKISFSFINNDKNIFEISKEKLEGNKNEILIERAKKILGNSFSENTVTLKNFEHFGENFETEIHGLISIPSFSIKNHQYIFVNKRPVKDRMLTAIIRSAYSTVMHESKTPNFILFFELDQFDVDVNVHPTKAEVRFRNPQKIKGILINKINEELSKLKITSTTIVNSFDKFIKKENQIFNLNEEKKIEEIKKFNQNANLENFNHDLEITENNNKKEDLKYSLFPITKNVMNNFSQKKFEEENLEYYKKIEEENLKEINNNSETQKKENYENHQTENYKDKTETINLNYNFLGTPKTQIFNSFIISETNEEIFLIDQHAAHERIIYEEIKLKIIFDSSGELIAKIPKQKLIFPEVYSVSESEKLIAKEYINQINSLGFFLEILEQNEKNEENKLRIKEIPLIMRDTDIKNLIFEIINEFKNYETSSAFLKKIHMIFATHACHTSIRANHKLTLIEMDSILRKIEITKNSSQCNHGRPSLIKLSKSSIEKLFERG